MNEQTEVRNQVWFITGTSSGFGRAIAEDVVGRGGRVVATARDPRSLEDLIARAPDRICALRLDVTKPAEIESAVASATERFGAIDVLVNNAGFSIIGALEETGERDLRDTMEPMFFGAVAMTRRVVPQMRQRGSGTIVQISSMGGLTTAPGFGAYCAAKRALEGLSECLAAELAPFGVRVLLVEPGAFRTRLFGGAFRMLPETPDYAATVKPIREWVAAADGKQPGDPVKAAQAIVDAVAAGAPNLRLPLGADAVDGIRATLARIGADVDSTESVARATAF
jgi:NAD(P)-dependent dehydrogenase (short-subunit alcohol dehydrogenase family)